MSDQLWCPLVTSPASHPGIPPTGTAEILDAEDDAWQLYLRGHSLKQIGQELARSTNWASLTICRLLELRASGPQQMMRAYVEKLLDEVSLIRQAAWLGWEQSQIAKVRSVAKTKEVGPRGGGGNESVKTTESQSGNASFLRTLIECNKRESALRGIERPTTVRAQCSQSHVDLDTLIQQVEAANAQDCQRNDSPADLGESGQYRAAPASQEETSP